MIVARDLAELRQATGADVRLWIGTPEDERERAAAALAAMPFVRAVSPNGAGVHVEAAADSHLRVLRGLEALGLRVSEFRTRAPALEDILERLVDRATEERGPSRRNP